MPALRRQEGLRRVIARSVSDEAIPGEVFNSAISIFDLRFSIFVSIDINFPFFVFRFQCTV